MGLNETIQNDVLTGVELGIEDIAKLRMVFESRLLPEWLLELCSTRRLAGTIFSLDDDCDKSRFGVEMKWMTSNEMIDEATNIFPGMMAINLGYLPIGICLEGSGDPYFLRIGPGPLHSPIVRIPHIAAVGDELDEKRVEIVADNLRAFFAHATVVAST